MAKKEELKNEAPMQLGAGFGIKVLIFAAGLVAIVVGIPYFLMK
jgi:hypothetical protein